MNRSSFQTNSDLWSWKLTDIRLLLSKKWMSAKKNIPPKKYAEIKRLCGSESPRKITKSFKSGLNKSMLFKKPIDLAFNSLKRLR